mmetsp:Transcript_18159/g.47906  ORF Transcript_18159/g.47906 Transcript_18159/m.47906 type:complete len:81 (-) Transcript_18159:42-284(-)
MDPSSRSSCGPARFARYSTASLVGCARKTTATSNGGETRRRPRGGDGGGRGGGGEGDGCGGGGGGGGGSAGYFGACHCAY